VKAAAPAAPAKTAPPLRILCCYTTLAPRTRHTLPSGTEMVCTAGDPYAYSAEIRSRWDGSASLVIIEHDIVIHPGVISGFAACRSPWCAFPYQPYAYSARGMLGCARFTPAAQQAVTPAQIAAAPGDCPEHGPRTGCWHQIADQVTAALETAGIAVCEHHPLVDHTREGGA
jgi:hypothetical protein